MRTVSTEASRLGLTDSDTVTVRLVNAIGGPCFTPDGYTFNETKSPAGGMLTFDLRENDTISVDTAYKLESQNGLKATFQVPSADSDAPPHDLVCLLKEGCFEGVVKKDGTHIDISPAFIEKLDVYFAGHDPHFTGNEKSLLDLFEHYADNTHETESTSDTARTVDEILAAHIEEENTDG